MNVIKKFKHQQPSDDIVIRNLQELMHAKDISEAELSRQTSIPPATIHKILSGKTSDPRISTLKTLADFFQVTLDQLYLENAANQQITSSSQGKSAPIITWEDCINSKKVIKMLNPRNWQNWAAIDNSLDSDGVYGLITRPSMEPRFPRGTMLIVDVKVRPADGDLVIVQYPNTNEATLRELSMDGPNKLLIPPNPNHPSDVLGDSIKILATVIQSRFSHQNP